MFPEVHVDHIGSPPIPHLKHLAHHDRANTGTQSQVRNAMALSPDIQNFLTTLNAGGASRVPVLFITFGTFASTGALIEAGKQITSTFIRGGGAVIYHNPSSSHYVRDAIKGSASTISPHALSHLHIVDGYSPYATILPHVTAVAFTGSMCMQLACYAAAVPMIFVPLLSEQYVWAKLFKESTGMPYIDVRAGKAGSAQIHNEAVAALSFFISEGAKVMSIIDSVHRDYVHGAYGKKFRDYALSIVAASRMG